MHLTYFPQYVIGTIGSFIYLFIFISKLHMDPMSFEPITSPSI